MIHNNNNNYRGVTAFRGTGERMSKRGVKELSIERGKEEKGTNEPIVITPIARSVGDLIQLFAHLFSSAQWKLDKTILPLPFPSQSFFNESQQERIKVGYYIGGDVNLSCQRAVLLSISSLRSLHYSVLFPFLLLLFYFSHR